MKHFLLLIKNNITMMFAGGNKKGKNKKTTPIAILIILGLFLETIMFFSAYFTAYANHVQDNDILTIYTGFVTILFICVLATIFKAGAYLFDSRDFDMLLALPIKPRIIVASKISSLLVYNYFLSFFIFLPNAVFYGYFATPSPLMYLGMLLIVLVNPLLIITICSIISYFFNLFIGKFKYKTVIKSIFLTLMFLVFLVFYFKVIMTVDDEEQIATTINPIINGIINVYIPLKWAINGITKNILELLLFFAVNVIPFILFVLIINKNYISARDAAHTKYREKNFELKSEKIKVSSPTKTLILRELKTYFSDSMVIMNTLVGSIMGTILIAVMVFNSSILEEIASLSNDLVSVVLVSVLVFTNGMISITASSISLEGKHFWIIKTSPLSTYSIFKSKIIFAMILEMPFVIVATVIASVALHLDVLTIIMMIVIPTLIIVFLSCFGLYINILFPKLNWEFAVKVVKQGISVGITMITGMLISMLTCAILFVITLIISNLILAYILTIIWLLILITVSMLLLKYHGSKRFNKISC